MSATIEQAGPYEADTAVGNGHATAAEIRDPAVPYAMGWMRDLPDVRDYTASHAEVAPLLAAAPAGRLVAAGADPALPARVDLRQWCSPIEDQRTIGSCTAQAGVGIVEYYQRRAFGKHLDGSRLFVYKATRNLLGLSGDTGAWLRSAMGALTLFGVPPERFWPYYFAKYDMEPPAFVYALGQTFQAEKFYRLDPGGTPPADLLVAIKQHSRPRCRRCSASPSTTLSRRPSAPAAPDPVPDRTTVAAPRLAASLHTRSRSATAATRHQARSSSATPPPHPYLPAYEYVLPPRHCGALKSEWIDTTRST